MVQINRYTVRLSDTQTCRVIHIRNKDRPFTIAEEDYLFSI